MELILTVLSRTKESFLSHKDKNCKSGVQLKLVCLWWKSLAPGGPLTNFSNRGSYFIPKKITTSEFAYPKKSLLFLAYPKKSLSPFFATQKNPCYFFSLPKKNPGVFHRPKKITFGQNFRPKKITLTPPPSLKINMWVGPLDHRLYIRFKNKYTEAMEDILHVHLCSRIHTPEWDVDLMNWNK